MRLTINRVSELYKGNVWESLGSPGDIFGRAWSAHRAIGRSPINLSGSCDVHYIGE